MHRLDPLGDDSIIPIPHCQNYMGHRLHGLCVPMPQNCKKTKTSLKISMTVTRNDGLAENASKTTWRCKAPRRGSKETTKREKGGKGGRKKWVKKEGGERREVCPHGSF